MRKHTLLCGCLILMAVTARNARAQVPSLPACYAMEVGTWSGSFPSGASAEHQPPDKLYLLPDSVTERYSMIAWRRAGPQNPALARGRFAGPPAWQSLSTDSVEVLWSNGRVGVVMHVRAQADSISGFALAIWDNIGPRQPTAPVRGARIPCPKPSD